MAGQYAVLKQAIQDVIKTNGNKEITGALMQQSLLAMITSLGAYYQFVDVATPSTNPGTPDQNVMYFAGTAGTYTNFGGIVVNDGEFCALCWNGSWIKKTTGAATAEQVIALGQDVDDLNDYVKGERNPSPISVLTNEMRYDTTNLVGYILNAHSTTKIEIYDVTALQGRTVTFKSYRYSNTYMNYALVKDYAQVPMPLSTNDYNANLTTYKNMWDGTEVDFQRSGTNIEQLTLPTGYESLYLLIQYNFNTMPLGTEFNLLNKGTGLEGRVAKNEADIAELNDEIGAGAGYADTTMLRKYMDEHYLDTDNEPIYTKDDAMVATDFDAQPYLERRVRDLQAAGATPKNSFAFITDTHWYPTNGTDGQEGSMRRSSQLADYVRKRIGFLKAVFGGDAFSVAQTKYKAAGMLSGYADDFFECFGKDGVFCIGNHDANQASLSQFGTRDWIPDTEIFKRTVGLMPQSEIVYDTDLLDTIATMISGGRLTISSADRAELEAWIHMHFYIDDKATKTRFVVMETNDEGYATTSVLGTTGFVNVAYLQYDFAAKCLASLPDGWNIVFAGHMFYQVNSSASEYGIANGWITLAKIISAYKTKGSIAVETPGPRVGIIRDIFNEGGSTHTYDFSGITATPNKAFCIFGHIHINTAFIVQDWTGLTDTPSKMYYTWGCAPYSDSLTQKPGAVLFVSSNADSWILDDITIPASTPSGVLGRTSHEKDCIEEHSWDVVTMLSDRIIFTKIGAGPDRVFLY